MKENWELVLVEFVRLCKKYPNDVITVCTALVVCHSNIDLMQYKEMNDTIVEDVQCKEFDLVSFYPYLFKTTDRESRINYIKEKIKEYEQ